MKCPNCNVELQELEDGGKKCPKCIYTMSAPTKSKGNKYIQQVNKQIKDLLVMSRFEDSPVPWQSQWVVIPKRNYDTNRQYNGVNRWLLAGIPELSFITQQSIEKRNLKLKKDASSYIVVAWIPPQLKKDEKSLTKVEQDEIMQKRRPFMVNHLVYMSKDVEELPEKTYEEDKNNKRFENIESFIDSLKKKGLEIVEGGNTPSVSGDIVKIPRIEQYNCSEEYYRDLFHEIAHWTGQSKRLDRKGTDQTEGKEYEREEMVAEMAAGYICQYFDIKITENSVAYIDHWVRQIDSDPYLLVSSGQRAEKVLKYLELE